MLPVTVLEGESIPEGVPELLMNAHVVLLGYHVVPDQTATGQARDQYEEKGLGRLDDLEALLAEAGATVETQLVFTHDGQTTIDRQTDDHDCLAVLIPTSTGPVDDVLVAIRGVSGVDRFIRLVAGLFAPPASEGVGSRIRSVIPGSESTPPGVGITLYHVADEDESDEDVETLLDGIATRLVEEGMPEDRIDIQVAREGDSKDQIIDASGDYDAVVMGESDPSVSTFFFGMTADQVANRFLGPVFVVQGGDGGDGGEGESNGSE